MTSRKYGKWGCPFCDAIYECLSFTVTGGGGSENLQICVTSLMDDLSNRENVGYDPG